MEGYIDYNEQKPADGVEVICFNPKWIDEDVNPKGVRIGFKNEDDFVTAHYWWYKDCYMTISHSECDDNDAFSEQIKNNIEPTHWRPI
ncbi:hypothetical protein [Chryseobacterium sp.]|uniref:hypothetical protein n=1 Tax=Chryseobacterium sp. TaxID=1871047 RepID=UPI0012AAB828|nr:hypothetical protein [Chryseobacterium sp.]QFG53658.1 hypothetical protein F7R58_08865 [Chryseobacterium sp.]